MNNNQEDTNIVSGDDLSFLQSIGIAPPSTQTIEEEVVESENVKTDETTQEETQTVSKTPDVNLENTFREELTPNTDYKKSIDVLLKNNVWEDTSIKYGDEEYESISELLNKIEVDEVLYESLVDLQNNLKETEIKNNYIPIAGIDDSKVKLAKAIVEGVDYKDLLEYKEDVLDPISNLNLNNEQTLIEFVKNGLKEIEGIPDRYIDLEINDLKSKFSLLAKAEEYKDYLKNQFDEELNTRTERLLIEKQEQEELRKSNIKTLRKELKESNFSPTFVEKAVQLRHSIGEDGNEHYISLLKEKIKSDKTFEKNIIHMLLDENDFYSKIKAPVKQETTKKVLELVKIVPSKTGKSITSKSNTSINEAEANFLNIIQNNNIK